MLSGFLLWIVFLIWACVIWRSTPPLLSESELASDEFRYRYATTPLRRWVIMTGSCVLFAAIFSFITYSLAFLIWSSFMFGWIDVDSHSGIKTLFFLVMAAAVIGATRIPKIRRFLMETCLFFKRYQFFPPLPSRKEEDLVEQLERLPAGTLPSDVEKVLAAGADGGGTLRHELYLTFGKLEKVHAQLADIAKRHRGVVKMFYFGGEWELIDNQYKAIEKQMHENASEVNDSLIQKTDTCLFYAYCLLTRYIMETSTSNADVKARFKAFGFDVAL
jgi:hypothetical protein